MNSVDHVLDQLQRLVTEHPEVASVALIAFAVEQGVLPDRTAKAWVRSLDLSDFEGTKAVLAREVDRAGRTTALVDLIRSGRRLQRRTEALLKTATRS